MEAPTDSIFALLFWSAFFASVFCELVLLALNWRELKKHEHAAPEFAKRVLSDDEYRRSVAYSREKLRLSFLREVSGAALLVLIVTSGFLGSYYSLLGTILPTGGIGFGVVYILSALFLISLTEIPFSLYSQFVIEERFGFNKMTGRLWLADYGKSLLLGGGIGAALLSGLLWFMQAAADRWWIYAALFLVVIQLLMSWLFPVYIAPLFNKFTPLPEGPLREALLALAKKAGFSTSGIFTMDGSRRSAHANAYFTGFGRSKRIVLFDTLIEKLSPAETTAVLAHEIGHEKLGHIKKGIALSLVMTVIGFFILSKLIAAPELYQLFGFTEGSYSAALLLFMVASGPFTYFLSPLMSLLSRRFEYQADAFTVQLLGQGQELGAALCKLSKNSLSNLTPHPLYSAFHYSHPTLRERLRALNY